MDIRRTRWTCWSVVAFLGLAISACSAPQQQPPASVQGQPAQVEKQKGGILVGPTSRLPSCLYFLAESCVIGGLKTTVLPIWEGILDFDYLEPGKQTQGVGKFAPRLAESWKQVDPVTWDFTLRKGVKWHDGKDFTAEDVLWSLDRWNDKISNSAVRTAAETFDKVESTGPNHVRIKLKAASPYFLDSITYIEPRILPAHIAKQAGNPEGDTLIKLYDANPIGTGPFRHRSFNRTASTEVERFDSYWGEGPYMDGIRVILLKDSATWMAAFATGGIDFLSLGDKVQKDTVLRSNPRSTVVGYLNDGSSGIMFNMANAPWNDVRVRRAVHLALDRETLRQTVTSGEGKPGFGPVPPMSSEGGIGIPYEEYMKLPGYRQPKAEDVAEARKLLAQAGLPANFKAVIKYDKGKLNSSAEAVAGLLRGSLGWDVTAQALEPATYLAEVELEKKFDLTVQTFSQHNRLANAIAQRWHSSGSDNNTGIKDPELDRMIDAAQVELDDTKRSQIFAQMQRYFDEKAYAAPVPMWVLYQLWQPWLHDFYGSLSSNPSLFNANVTWLEVEKLPADRRGW